MSKKTLALIGFATIIAAAAAFLHAAAPKDKGEGKFHLVYLVSTDKVEVGAKAYVEPLFFTDGKRLVFAYDYCRQYYQRLQKKPETAYPGILIRKEDLIYPRQIASDLKVFHTYCDGKDLHVDFSAHMVRDNSGLRLNLSKATFELHKATDDNPDLGGRPPVFPERGTTMIQAVEGAPVFKPDVTIENGQQYFFLASDSATILDRIAPVVRVGNNDQRSIKAQLQNYAHSRTSAVDSNEKFKECSFGYPFNHKGFLQGQGPVKLERVSLLAATIADLDRDGRPDAVVSLRADGLFERTGGRVQGSTTEIRLVFGNNRSKCYAWSPGVPEKSFPTLLPLAFIWINGNGYLITTQGAYGGYGDSYSVVSVVPPDSSKTIKTGIKTNPGPL